MGGAALAIGLLGGMVGISFGIIRLPVMLAMGFDPLISFGTDLGVSLLGGLGALGPHLRGGYVRGPVVVVLGVPTLVGGFLGALAAGYVPDWSLLAVVAVIMVWSGAAMVRQALRRRVPVPAPGDPAGARELRFWYDGGIGFGLGLLGGAVGMVLGALRLPALIQLLRLDPRTAAGTANAIGVLVAVFAFLGFAISGRFDPRILMINGCCSLVGSFAGALLTGRTRPARLGLLIGLLVLGLSPLIAYNAVRAALS